MMRKLSLAVVLVLVASGILGSSRGCDRKKVEFAYALSPVSQQAVDEAEAWEVGIWHIPGYAGKMRIRALIKEFGRRTRYAWISPTYIDPDQTPTLSEEMPEGGFYFLLKDGTPEYRSVSRVSPESPDAVIKFGKGRKFKYPGESSATTLGELFEIMDPYPEPPPKPEAVSDAISMAIFCSQSPAEDVSDNPAYSEVAWVGPKGVRGRRDCGGFIFAKTDGSDIVVHRCLR